MSTDGGRREDVAKLYRGIMNNAPECLPELDVTTNEKRKAMNSWRVRPPPGQSYSGQAMVRLPKPVSSHFDTFAQKLGAAVYYKETGRRVDADHRALTGWGQLGLPNTQQAMDELLSAMPGLTLGQRRNTDIGDQFGYRWGVGTDQSFGMLAVFGNAFAVFAGLAPLAVVLANDPGKTDWLTYPSRRPG